MHTGLDQEATIELGTDILTGELKADDPIWNGLQQRGVSRDAVHGAISQVVQVGQQIATSYRVLQATAQRSRLS